MTAPKRLLEEGTSVDRALLRAGREDRPSRALERRIAAVVAAAPEASAANLATPSLLSRLGRSRGIALAVVLGASVAVLGVVTREGSLTVPDRGPPPSASSAEAIEAAPDDREQRPEPDPQPKAENQASPSTAVVTPDALPSVRPSPPRAENKLSVVHAPDAPPSPPPDGHGAAASPSLEREVELLDGVKERLRAGSFAEAGRALDTYDAEFPQGLLRPEAGLLRVRVLLAKGDKPAAISLAEDLLRRHPNSVHAKRIRALLATDGGA